MTRNGKEFNQFWSLLIILALVVNLRIVVGAGPVLASSVPTLTIQETTITPGETIHLTAANFTPGAALHSVIFGPAALSRYGESTPSPSTVTFDSNGSAAFTVKVPTNLNPNDSMVTIWAGLSYSSEQSAEATFTLTASSAVPEITSLTPSSGSAGATVTLNGSNFGTSASHVYLMEPSQTELTSSSWSDTCVSVNIPSGASAGDDALWLDNGSVLSNVVTFTVNASPAIPSITLISPVIGSEGIHVVLTGSGFTGATAVKFGTQAATFTVNADTSISAVVPQGTPGSQVHITVTNPVGTSTPANADLFTYEATGGGGTGGTTKAPSITQISPSDGSVNGNTTVVIYGSGFTGATAVKFGTQAASFQVNSDTQITAVSPAGTLGSKADITVTTSAGTSATSAADQFTYRAPAPPHLVFTAQPAATQSADTSLSVTAAVYDENNQVVTGNTDQITLFPLNNNLPTLLKTTSSYVSQAVQGVATFSAISLPIPDTSYALLAIDTSNAQVSGAQSSSFAVTPAANQTASLAVTITTPDGAIPALAGSILSVWSETEHSGAAAVVSGAGTYNLNHLEPASDYTVSLTAAGNNSLYEQSNVPVTQLSTPLAVTLLPEAALDLQVTNASSGMSLENMQVKVTVQHDSSTFNYGGVTDANGAIPEISQLMSGDQVQITVTPTGKQLFVSASSTITLTAGTNSPVIKLTAIPLVDLSGAVTNASNVPVSGAAVNVSQTYAGRSFGFSAITDQNGNYTIPVIETSGTQVRAFPPQSDVNDGISDTATVDLSAGATTQNLSLPYLGAPLAGYLTVNLYTTYAGSTEQQVPLDWRAAVHYGLIISDAEGNTLINNANFSNPLPISAHPGDKLTVAIQNAHSIGLPDTSQTVTVDANGNADAELHLVQSMGIKGTIQDSSGQPVDGVAGSLYAVDNSGKRTWLYDFKNIYNVGNQISLGLTQPGNYIAQFKEGLVGSTPEISVANGQVVDVGVITLSQLGYFSGQDGNGVDAQPATAAPGGTVTLYTHYVNKGGATAQQAGLQLEIPAGTSLVTGSTVLNGNQVTASAVGSNFTVPLGDVASGASGIFSYQLKVDADFTNSKFTANVGIAYQNSQGSVTESLGSADITVDTLTLQAPARLNVSQFTLTGQAPAASTVSIYDGNVLLGSVVAAANGFWQMPVTLADKGSPSYHTLYAQAQTSSGALSSLRTTLYYDDSAPQITKIDMQQNAEGCGDYSFDPRQGISRFPFVYVPGVPMNIQLTVDKPEDVYDVQLYFGNGGQAAAQLGADGLFHAQITPQGNVVPGDFSVGYKTRTSLNEFINKSQPTADQVRNQVPPAMSDFQLGQNSGNSGSNDVTITLPQYNNGQVKISTTVEGTQNYTPTAADRALVKQTGVPIYGYSFNQTTDAAGNTVETFSYYVPQDQATAEAAMQGDPTLEQVKEVITAGKEVVNGVLEQGGNLWSVNGLTNTAASSYGGTDIWAKFQAASQYLSDHVKDLNAQQVQYYQDQLNNFRNQLMTDQGITGAVDIAGTVYSPETMGGTLILNAATYGIGQIQNVDWNTQLDTIYYDMDDAVTKSVLNHVNQVLDQYNQENAQTVAQPTYLIDPSGYVYEGVTQNRLSGVNAQVMVWDAQDSAWEAWDAADYGQINPETTDSQGDYGWDVPTGTYQVVFSKTGYNSARSDSVSVPPPQTGINIGLISQSTPQVAAVTLSPGGASVDVSFSQYMKADAFSTTGSSITLTDSSSNPVQGTLLPVNPVVAPNGIPLVLAARFTPDMPLTVGSTYHVSVSQAVYNYAGTSMSAAYTGSVTVPATASQPAVTGISPGYGPQAGGTQVILKGSGFTGATTVSFGTTQVSSILVDSDSQIRVTSPTGSGMVNVTVTGSGGTSAVNSNAQFSYQSVTPAALPDITALNVTSGAQDGGTQVGITGSGFTGATAVNFGFLPAASFSVNSDTSITAVSPLGVGSVPVTVTTPNGTSAMSDAIFSYIPAYAVLYDGNGCSSGNAPMDSHTYQQGTAVTVLGNSDALFRPGYSFAGWKTAADGSGTAYSAGATFTMGTANVTLFAQWAEDSSGNDGGGFGGSSAGTQPEPANTVTGSVIDGTTRSQVSNLTATMTTDSLGRSTVALKASHALTIDEPGGTAGQEFTDMSKVDFTSAAGQPISVAADGTLTVSNLAKGTDNIYNITYDLGDGQKITVGTLEIMLDSSGKASLTTTLIDPYGQITDEVTGKPVSGVTITLYYANTERNKAAGKIPDTVVPLPGIAGFKPNNNQNPQVSDASGAYGFMVFPDSDYYLVAAKDGYVKYTSPTISVGKEIVKWNFAMHAAGTERLFGQDRVDTSLTIAKAAFNNPLSSVILATADNYPDALTGSVLAAKLNAPILLVESTVDAQNKILTYLKDNLDPAGTVYILGGTGVVSSDVAAEIQADGFKNIIRLGGTDRYTTSVEIAESESVTAGTPVVLVSGDNYPDALSVSSAAAVNQYPVLLVSKDGIPDAVKQEIFKINPSKVYIIGLQGVISTAVEDQLAQIISIDRTNILRIGGQDRFATSLDVAKYFNLLKDLVCVATGNNFPDALAGSVYAALNKAPILLVDNDMSEYQMTYLRSSQITGTTIFRGKGAVSQDIEGELNMVIGNK